MSNSDLEILDRSATKGAIEALASGKATVFSTITGNDHATKLEVFNAVTNSLPIADNLGKTINLVNIVVQSVEMTDENSGEVQDVPRTILVDADGTAYHAISGGLFRSVETMLGVVGHPSGWPAPLPVAVTREGSGTNKYFTMRPVKASK